MRQLPERGGGRRSNSRLAKRGCFLGCRRASSSAMRSALGAVRASERSGHSQASKDARVATVRELSTAWVRVGGRLGLNKPPMDPCALQGVRDVATTAFRARAGRQDIPCHVCVQWRSPALPSRCHSSPSRGQPAACAAEIFGGADLIGGCGGGASTPRPAAFASSPEVEEHGGKRHKNTSMTRACISRC